MIKRNLLLLSNTGRGALKPFPAKFELPSSIVAGEKEIEFFKTNRVKTIDGEQCPIYVEGKYSQLNLDDFSDPVEESVNQEPVFVKSSAEKLDSIRVILDKQIAWYKEYSEKEKNGEVDSSYVYDQMYEVFQDNLSRGDFVAIIEELI